MAQKSIVLPSELPAKPPPRPPPISSNKFPVHFNSKKKIYDEFIDQLRGSMMNFGLPDLRSMTRIRKLRLFYFAF